MPYKDLEKRREFSRTCSREWRRKNKDLVNARVKEDRLKNPEKYRAYDRKHRLKNLKRSRLLDVLNKKKITKVQYDALFVMHNSSCAICFKQENIRGRTGEMMPLFIDHCHKCEAHIRGLLCHDCNTALGKAKDNINLIKAGILYLKKHSAITK